jgi:hypothetical protein
MSSAPATPPVALVRRADAVIDLFGRFDLLDAELRAVRVTLAPGNVPTLEADLRLAGGRAADGAPADRAAEYCVTLRCTDVADLSLADFEYRNVVTGWAVEPAEQDGADGRNVRVTLTGAPGCDLDLRCALVEVVRVAPVPEDEAI